MLIICRSFSQLNIPDLVGVYQESIQQFGKQNYPNLTEDRQVLEAEQDFYGFLSEFFRVSGAAYFVWASEGRYKSALRIEPYRDGILIEGLETAPCSRHKGYAKKLLEATLQTIPDGKMYSHIKKDNRYSIAVHLACGFTQISDCSVYIDGSVDYHANTYMKQCGT